MSEPKLISPLLDGFVMGDPISDHHGVRCCPAMQTDSGSKYIVKIISVPASQTKLDALLLAGAFRDSASALQYFGELADGIVEEAVLLQRLSRLEGFVAFDKWQVVPMENGETGFDVYLTAAYRKTLERLLRKDSLTHLGAVNLGLDLCASLAVCRRLGYLYVDLKPENVAVCQDHEYRICDLGFAPLSSLAYASLPERCISAYTPPEIRDAYDPLNTTMDVYAAGLILYQVYNGGVLPFEGRATSAPLSAPQYADSEMAQIILKACDPNPEVRWADPLQMGQALVSYMQSHSINDTSIVVPAAPVMPEILDEEPEAQPEEPSTDDILAEVDQALDAVGVTTELPEEGVTDALEEAVDMPEEAAEAPVAVPEEEDATMSSEAADCDADTQAEVPFEEEPDAVETSEPEKAPEEPEISADSADEEAIPVEEEADFSAEAAVIQQELGVSEEVSQMLAQAESLIAHETPDPVVAPEPVDIPIPAPIVLESEDAAQSEPEVQEAPAAVQEQDVQIQETSGQDEYTDEAEEDEDLPAAKPRKKRKGWIALLICLALLAGIAFGANLYYENTYLQTIRAISLQGQEDRLTVLLDTDIEDSLLTVYCTDTYGNTVKQTVSGKKAEFRNLNPGTRYKISVTIDGFHKLVGVTNSVHTTSEQTVLSNLTAVTGAEDGSVILNFTVQGPESTEWKVTCTAEGEQTKTLTFPGHMVNVTGLTVGKEYTFLLEPTAPLYVVGTDSVKHTASKIIFAEELTIHGFHNGGLKTSWHAPQGATVAQWIVRCYNDKGFDKTITTDALSAVFENLDVSAAYTVEVTAAGMTQGTRTFVSANSVTVGEIKLDHSDRSQLSVSWDFEGTAPEGGWLLLYSMDGSEEQQVVQCTQNAGVIAPVIPGSSYSITVKPANGSTVFGGTAQFDAPAAAAFSGYLISAEDMLFYMCKTPENPEWIATDVPLADYRYTYTIGENASFAVHMNHEYNTSSDTIITLFVIRDAQGKIFSTATQSRTWTSMWYRGFGRINIPSLPGKAGEYTVEVYFNGALAHSQAFTMV